MVMTLSNISSHAGEIPAPQPITLEGVRASWATRDANRNQDIQQEFEARVLEIDLEIIACEVAHEENLKRIDANRKESSELAERVLKGDFSSLKKSDSLGSIIEKEDRKCPCIMHRSGRSVASLFGKLFRFLAFWNWWRS